MAKTICVLFAMMVLTGCSGSASPTTDTVKLDPGSVSLQDADAAPAQGSSSGSSGSCGCTDGPQGPIGLTGATGPQGPAGPAGAAGAQGPGGSGPAGPAGEQGPAGPAGPAGSVGPVGPQGIQGATGAAGAAGAGLAVGSVYFVTGTSMPDAVSGGAVAFAACKTDTDVLLSGGCIFEGQLLEVFGPRNDGLQSKNMYWFCQGYNTSSGTTTLTATAECLAVP